MSFDFTEYTTLGAILLRAGAITKRQLARVLKAQTNGHSGQLFGDVVISLGFCEREDVIAAIEHQNAVRPQAITPEREALQELRVGLDRAEIAVETNKARQKHNTQTMMALAISPGEES